jgi:hypothetical protein
MHNLCTHNLCTHNRKARGQGPQPRRGRRRGSPFSRKDRNSRSVASRSAAACAALSSACSDLTCSCISLRGLICGASGGWSRRPLARRPPAAGAVNAAASTPQPRTRALAHVLLRRVGDVDLGPIWRGRQLREGHYRRQQRGVDVGARRLLAQRCQQAELDLRGAGPGSGSETGPSRPDSRFGAPRGLTCSACLSMESRNSCSAPDPSPWGGVEFQCDAGIGLGLLGWCGRARALSCERYAPSPSPPRPRRTSCRLAGIRDSTSSMTAPQTPSRAGLRPRLPWL